MEKIERRDIELGQYILSMLSMRMDVVGSWGLDPETLRPLKCGIEFHVQGFKHTGKVQVRLNEGEDLFEVSLIPDSGEIVNSIQSVHLDTLISTIDDAVENVEGYEKRVCEEYPNLVDPDNPDKVKPVEVIIL